MVVSSVSSSSYSPATQTQAKVQSQPAEQPKQTQQTQQKQPTQETQAASNEQRKPPPVVNTQGQTTGRIVNTSA
jgi:hypothetical protein